MVSATRKWILLKISSLLMVPFMIWFIVKFASIYDGDYQNVVAFFSTQTSTIVFSVFIVITLELLLVACVIATKLRHQMPPF